MPFCSGQPCVLRQKLLCLSLALKSWLVQPVFVFCVQLLLPYFTATLLMRDARVPKTHFPQVYCPSTEIRPCLPRQKLEHIYLTHKVTSVRCPLTEAGLFSSLALYQMEQNIISARFAVTLQSEHPKPGKEKYYERNLC